MNITFYRACRQSLLRLVMGKKNWLDPMNVIFLSFAMIWSTGQMGQIFGASSKIFFLDIFVGLIVLAFIASGLFERKYKIKTVVLFLALVLLSFLINIWGKSTDEISRGLMYLSRFFGIWGLYFVVQNSDRTKIEKSINLGLVAYLFFACIQYIWIPDTRIIKLLGYDDHYFRAIGTLLDPNLSAIIYIWAFYWFDNKKNSLFWQTVSILLLAASFSRSGYLAFVFSLFLIFLRDFRWSRFVWIPILFVFVWFVPKPFGEGVNLTRTYSVSSRIENTKENLSIKPTRLLFGEGYNFVTTNKNTNYTNRSSSVDNSYLYLIKTIGIVGLIGFLYLVADFFAVVRRENWAIGAFGALMIGGILNNTLFQLQIMILWVVCLGYLGRISDDK